MKEYANLSLKRVCSLVAKYDKTAEIFITNDDFDPNRGNSFTYEDNLFDFSDADDVIICFDDGVGLPFWLIKSKAWRVFIRKLK